MQRKTETISIGLAPAYRPHSSPLASLLGLGCLLSIMGCKQDLPLPTEVVPPSPSSLLNGNETMVSLPERYASAGCAFVATRDNGEQLEAILPRTELPRIVPRTDSIPSVAGRAPGIKVISGSFVQRLTTGSATVRFSCLASLTTPNARSTHAIASALQRIDGSALEKLLGAYPVPKQVTTRAAEFARAGRSFRSTDLLLAKVSPSYVRPASLAITVSARPSTARSRSTPGISPLSVPMAFSQWYESGLRYPQGHIDTLRTVVVHGHYPDPVIVDLSWILSQLETRNLRFFDWTNATDIAIQAQECNDANAGVDAAVVALEAMEQDANDIDAAGQEVAQYNCEHDPNLVSDSQIICIDFFIMGRTALLFMLGDERTYNSNAPYTDSRVQIYIDPAHPDSVTILYNSTTVLLPIPWADTLKHWNFGPQSVFTPFAHLPRDVSVRDSSGSIVVKVELYNGACKSFGSGWVARDLCPAIDAKITMTPNGSGSWTVYYDRDAFPSIQVNKRAPGGQSWSEVSHSDEEHTRFAPLNLINLTWTRWFDKYNEARYNFRLPDGCERQ